MKQNNHRLFAQLLETLLVEASTGVDIARGSPGGTEVMRYMHQKTPLPPDINWEKTKKVQWSDLKSPRRHRWGWGNETAARGGWVLVLGKQGTGAVFANDNGGYLAYASTGLKGDTDNAGNANRLIGVPARTGSEAIRLIKAITGPVFSYAVATNTKKSGSDDITQKREKRREIAPSVVTQINDYRDASVMVERLLRRFKGIWITAITQAIADIKGFASMQMKNDAFHVVDKKLEKLKKLDSWRQLLVDGGDVSNTGLKNILVHAVDLAARNKFPDLVPDAATLSFYKEEGDRRIPEGYKKLLDGIAAGDTGLLSTVLYFFKRSLLVK